MKRVLSIILSFLLVFSVIPIFSLTANAEETDVIEIRTIEELYAINNNMSGNYKLMNDIDMTEDFGIWEPIGRGTVFTGTFDGNGFAIKNIKIGVSVVSNIHYSGLFSQLHDATIKNLGIEECSIALDLYSSSDIYVYVGGISGFSDSSSIYNCYCTGDISSSLQGKDTTSVKLNSYVGGICGASPSSTIINSYNKSAISSTVKGSYNMYSYLGGISGSGYMIKNCFNSGDLDSNHAFGGTGNRAARIGGISGSQNSIDNCYNTGSVLMYYSAGSGVTYTAISAGISPSVNEITNCYNTGIITKTKKNSFSDPGYAICEKANLLTDCYYLEGKGSNDITGITSLSENQFLMKAFFIGFDFESTWIIDSATSYKHPQLIHNRQDTVKIVDYIKLTSYPDKISYFTGDKFKYDGGQITAYYIDGSFEKINLSLDMLSGYDLTVIGTQTVTVTFREGSCTFEINVLERPNTIGMSLLSEPIQKEFVKGTFFDFTGCQVEVAYDNGTTEIIDIEEELVTGEDINTVGVQIVSFKRGDFSVSFEIEVLPIKTESIELTSLPTKLTYIEGQEFDETGLVVTAYNNNGTSYEATGYTLSGYSDTVGKKTITVSFSSLTKTFEVEVIKKTATDIKITSQPTKTQYIQGQKFDNAGMVVEVTFDNGKAEIVTDYTVDVFSEKIGIQSVAVRYENVIAYISLTVIEKAVTSIYIKEQPTKTKYIQDEDFDTTGLVIYAKYNDNTESEISNYTLSGNNTKTTGTKIVTVSYGGKATAFTFAVVAKTLQKITVDLPSKTSYLEGEEFDSTGIKVFGHYDNGKSYEVTDYTISGFTGDVGINNIIVAYEDKTYDFSVTVHNPSEKWVVTIKPTCTEKGEKELYCTECSELLKTEKIDALGHTEVVDKGYDATCTEDGLTDGKHCTVCQTVLVSQNVITAKGHTLSEEWTTTKTPTCTQKGTKVKYCKWCDEIVETADIDMSAHTVVFDEAVSATCLNSGLTEGSHCSVCNIVLVAQEVVQPKGHKWDDGYVSISSTCVTTGEITYHCQNCTATKTETVQALSHDFDDEFTVDKKATCTENGSKSRHCSRCDVVTEQTVIKKLGHDFSNYISDNNTTCTKDGTKTAQCSRCEATDTIIDEGSAKGHQSSDWETTKQPTCTSSGTKIKYCTVCQTILQTETIFAIGHTTIVDEAVAPTCTKTGLTEGSHCSVCNTVFVEQKVVKALGHDYDDEFTIDKNATCTENGSKSKHCSRCDSKISVTEISATGHNYNKWVIDKESSCTETGKKHKVCENCNDTIVEYTALISHVSSDWTIREKPTCINEGTKVKCCTACNTTLQSESIEALGHTEVVDKTVAPTCIQTGLTEGKHCSVCNKVLVKQEVVSAKGHTEVIVGANSATYFANGYKGDKKCSVCNIVVSKGTTITKLKLKTPKFKYTNGKKKFTVKYTKVADATGFQVRYKLKGKWKTLTFETKKSAKRVIKKLKKGNYKVQIRAFVKSGSKKAYSNWSKTKTVKVK